MSLCSSTAAIMKYITPLFAILAIISLGHAHRFPDFGTGSLNEDIQDLLNLVPSKEIQGIVLDYISGDPEVQKAFNYLRTSTVLKDLMVDLEAIPEVINLLNYMQKEGVDVYSLVNKANKALGIDEIVPPSSRLYSSIIQRTGGIAGLVKDITDVIPFEKFIRIYVQKMKSSSAFISFVNQLKSDNCQQAVNKVYQIESLQIILKGLKSSGVNTQIIADIMYIVLGINVPNDVTVYQERTVEEELMDFVQLIPAEQFTETVLKYITEDEKVQYALQYVQTPEFHSILRDVEALKEHQALAAYLEKAGLNVTNYLKNVHKAIGMEDYVPPKVKSIFESQIGIQKIGDGLKGMLKELYNMLPIDKIKALYKEKLQTSKVFADFIQKLKSPEMQKLINDLYGNQTFKNFVTEARENGLEFQEMMKLATRIFGFTFPYYNWYM